MRPPSTTPAATSRRPAEPFRPAPVRRRRAGVTLLAAQARRRRFRAALPPSDR